MPAAIARRIATAVVTLLVVTLLVFALMSALPGDAIDEESSRALPPEFRSALRAQYHLDEPAPVRYGRWLADLGRGELGTSLSTGQPVGELLRDRLPVSLALNTFALAVLVAIALPLGILGAWKPGGAWDRVGLGATTVLYAVPVFWSALLLQWAFGVRLHWLPLSGIATEGAVHAGLLAGKADNLRHLVLPAVCLAGGGLAYVSRFVRTSLVESSSGDGGRAARARGLSTLEYLWRHGLRQSAVPLLTLAGFLIPRLVGGSLLIEQIFGVPGLGSLMFKSILGRDVPVVLALTLVSGVAALVGTTVADLLIACVDPRVRRAG